MLELDGCEAAKLIRALDLNYRPLLIGVSAFTIHLPFVQAALNESLDG